jgi:hypothetical protein
MRELLARVLEYFGPRVTLQDKPLAEPVVLYGAPRPMTGLFASLSEEQQKCALGYRGEEDQGPQEFSRAAR